MRILFLFCLLIFSFSLNAYENAFEVYLEGSDQWNIFKWENKNTGNLLNSFEKGEWKNIQSPQIKGGVCMRPFYDFIDCTGSQYLSCLAVEIEVGTIISIPSGDFFSVYHENPSSLIFTNHGGKKNWIRGNDFSVSLGYDLFVTPSVLVIPLVGYASQNRQLKAHPKHFTSQSPEAADIEVFDIAIVKDKGHWHGPWIGLYTEISPYSDCRWKFIGGAEFHFDSFRNQVRWKTTEIFEDGFSFFTAGKIHQKGYFNGYKGRLALQYNFYEGWTISIGGIYENFSKNKGSDNSQNTLIIKNPAGKIIGTSTTQNDEKYHVQWQSVGVTTSINYIF